MKQIEIEYKSLLSQGEFKRLSNRFQQVPLISQTNYYFDTLDRQLRQAKLSLRIRTLADRAELTLKIPQPIGNMEHNLNLTLQEAEEMIGNNRLTLNTITDLLVQKDFPLEEIINLGSLTTHRREVQLPIGLLAIDENHYADHIDYELELEVTDSEEGKKAFKKFLMDHAIGFKYAKSKVVRFLETLEKVD